MAHDSGPPPHMLSDVILAALMFAILAGMAGLVAWFFVHLYQMYGPDPLPFVFWPAIIGLVAGAFYGARDHAKRVAANRNP